MRTWLVLAIVLFLSFESLGANMLTNPGFEQGTSGWVFSGGAFDEFWASRSGSTGAYFRGWDSGLSPGSAYQDVTVASTGTYTFAVWVRRELNFNLTSASISLEWYDANTNALQAASVKDLSALPNDEMWHLVHVTGDCGDGSLAFVRAKVNAAWGFHDTDPRTLMFDDTYLDAGVFQGSLLANGSFENSNTDWSRAQWNGDPKRLEWVTGGYLGESWANHSGTQGVALFSWDDTSTDYQLTFWQNSYPLTGTGTYTFTIWIDEEANALWSNVAMSIEWYDTNWTKVSEAAVSNLVVTKTGWKEYWVTGVCTSPALHEARVVFSADWSFTPAADPRSIKIDDARFLRGAYDGTSMNTDWIYHAAPGYTAAMEQVPGTNVGAFFQADYSTRTNTFYLLTPKVGELAKQDGEGVKVEVRTAWQVPYTDTWVEVYTLMENVGTVELTDAAPFHGLPAAGTQTAALWRCYWEHPRNPTNGVFYSNEAIRVYYAPFIKTTNGVMETDYRFVTKSSHSTSVTNNLGQLLAKDYANVDYSFLSYKPPTWAVFTNGGFENPLLVTNWLNDTGWWGVGRVNREPWANRSGLWGAAFTSWDPGEAILFQDVATTGGTHIFSTWAQLEPVATNYYYLNMKMEWYAKDGTLLQVNEQSLLDLPNRYTWSEVFVVGTCTDTNLDFVRLLLEGAWGETDAGGESLKFDDAKFGWLDPGLANGGFEIGLFQDTPSWYRMPSYLVEIHEWAKLTGSNGMAFHGWEEDTNSYQASVAQPVVGVITGSYIYSLWIKREVNFVNLTHAELRLEWYGADYANKVQADTVLSINPPNDGNWALYAITGTCLNVNLGFVQPVLFAQWDKNPTADNRSMMMDDASLVYTNYGPSETDGIPNWWWELYFPGQPAEWVAGNDPDDDTYTNGEEYAADTRPDDQDSVPNVDAGSPTPGGARVWDLEIPETTNSRLYDVWWRIDLLPEDAGWTPMGRNVTGTGGAIVLTVTNDVDLKFYRTGVRVP